MTVIHLNDLYHAANKARRQFNVGLLTEKEFDKALDDFMFATDNLWDSSSDITIKQHQDAVRYWAQNRLGSYWQKLPDRSKDALVDAVITFGQEAWDCLRQAYDNQRPLTHFFEQYAD